MTGSITSNVRRSAHAKFAVWGNKYGEDPMTGKRRWMDWDKTSDLRSPAAVKKALEDEAEFLGVEIDWSDALPLIAMIDRLSAAVIASITGLKVPARPATDVLLEQRALRPLGQVTIGVMWGYDMHELQLSFERWIRILGGEAWTIEDPYWYEGQRFAGCWAFNGQGGLEVTYDDGGVDIARLALSAVPRQIQPPHSTVTDLAKFRGLSTSVPRAQAV